MHARSSRKKASEIVREVLERDLAGPDSTPSCYDLARKAKAIGCAKGAPRDLSTNRRHFKGFGGR